MSKEVLDYLNEQKRQTIEEWCEEILPLLEKYPRLKEIDLVIEGGAGTGTTMTDISRRLFPEAFYLGTDIAARMMTGILGGKRRLVESIDYDSLRKAQIANATPSSQMIDARIFANCFDTKLVRDIAEKTNRQHPILVSYKALYALEDPKMNPWDRKSEDDLISIEDMVDLSLPYEAQIHVGIFWDKTSEEDKGDKVYFMLEKVGKESGWTTERFDCGLLLLRPSE